MEDALNRYLHPHENVHHLEIVQRYGAPGVRVRAAQGAPPGTF
jgi:hypothetical protein